MFRKVLIANRGEIAARIGRTLKRMGIASVAVYSDADRFTRPVLDADEAVRVGPGPAAESYLNVEAILRACEQTGAEAVHPGYGFLSENAAFAEALAARGIAFIGPRPEHLRAFGLKHEARALALAADLPLLPGSGLLDDAGQAQSEAAIIGFPVILKSTAGGGGIGMQICSDAGDLAVKYDTAKRTAQAAFGDARLYLERYIARARHVEVQIFGDGLGRVAALGERDCSLQRRNQKVFEETPAPHFPDGVRQRMLHAATTLGASVMYESAGTVEFIYDEAREDFSFLEVNTRLQVEHPVTEAVFGIDLVEAMIRQAAGEDVVSGLMHLTPKGAAIEARLYAENPHAGFRPSTGLVTEAVWSEGARNDRWVEAGAEVTSLYDPLLAKIIVHAEDRPAAVAAMAKALNETRISGLETNLAYLGAVAASEEFARGEVATSVLGHFPFAPSTIDVLAPGAVSSLQELPGRLGLWHVGVPPSGPMDERSFRAANRAVGNPETAAALELTMIGPTLRFNRPATFALSGAAIPATLDGEPVTLNSPVEAAAGQTLALGRVEGAGLRTYLAVRGGFEAPEVLGSRATFAAGKFGGHATGALRTGDVLHFGQGVKPAGEPRALSADEIAPLTSDWTLQVVYGPHGAPDFFTETDIETLFAAPYTVHFNSDRTGVRLTGPQPAWARKDGGEAGLHPSNIHDNAYAIGSIDFTGDMPIILGPDGPSLGGFVCPAVLAEDELWKMGQLKPGDTVRFVPVERSLDPVAGPTVITKAGDTGSAIVGANEDAAVPVVYRRAGDANLLVEYGPKTLDIALRLRVHALHEALQSSSLKGIVDLTPGIRSLQIHYDSTQLSRPKLLAALAELEQSLPAAEATRIPNRIVHLPLSWNDSQVVLAMRKYQELVRPDAPWCPDNIEFIRRINGLKDEQAVKDTIFDADFFVLGLGDVYLGAPVATPLDPRHRLVTTKYNPARTWTPENAVGIGGAYMCIYGMEGPGGYQLFGRTIQVWNTWRHTPPFDREPWLLRFFDQVKFHPVSEAELADARADFPHGRYPIKIEENTFDYGQYSAYLTSNAPSIAAFKSTQQAAFESERARWRELGLDSFVSDTAVAQPADSSVPEGCMAVEAPVTGNVWKIVAEPGTRITAGEPILIVESMKMELPVVSPVSGKVREIRTKPGRLVSHGDTVAIVEL